MTNCFKSVLNLKNGPRDDDVWSNKTLEKKFGHILLYLNVSLSLFLSFFLSFSLSLSFSSHLLSVFTSLSQFFLYAFISFSLCISFSFFIFISISYFLTLNRSCKQNGTLWNFCNVLSFSFVKLQKQKLLIEFNAENKQNNVGWLGHCLDACSRIFLPVFKTT